MGRSVICAFLVYGILWAHIGLVVNNPPDKELRKTVAELLDQTDKFCVRHIDSPSWLCMNIQSDNATWDKAQEICADWDGRLPETESDGDLPGPESKRERAALGIIVKKRLTNMWLGGRLLRTGPDNEDGMDRPEPGNRPDQQNPDHWRGPRGTPPPNRPPDWSQDGSLDAACPPPDGRPGRRHPGCRHSRCSVYQGGNSTHERTPHHANCFEHMQYICVATKENHTGTCPGGFRKCSARTGCYKLMDEKTNWFRANQLCKKEPARARLPDITKDSELHTVMRCFYEEYFLKRNGNTGSRGSDDRSEERPECAFFWSSQSSVNWIWNSTGDVIDETSWDTLQPQCPLEDCIEMKANGDWSVVNCGKKRNFTCIKVGKDCAECEHKIYGDSSNEDNDDQAGMSSEYEPPRLDMIIGIVVLCIIVVAVIIALIAVSYKIKKNKRVAQQQMRNQQQYLEAVYEHLARRESIYENDSHEYNIYNTLDLEQPSNLYTTIGPEGMTGDQASRVNKEGNPNMNIKNLKPRKGSLPSTPDVVPLGPIFKKKDSDYLEVFPCPYKDYKSMTMKNSNNNNNNNNNNRKRIEDLAEESSIKSNDTAYADRPVSKEIEYCASQQVLAPDAAKGVSSSGGNDTPKPKDDCSNVMDKAAKSKDDCSTVKEKAAKSKDDCSNVKEKVPRNEDDCSDVKGKADKSNDDCSNVKEKTPKTKGDSLLGDSIVLKVNGDCTSGKTKEDKANTDFSSPDKNASKVKNESSSKEKKSLKAPENNCSSAEKKSITKI